MVNLRGAVALVLLMGLLQGYAFSPKAILNLRLKGAHYKFLSLTVFEKD